ncbi:hypothetical protein [Tenuibacillus multivorans]|uniref:YceG-like family protein n=1 Tax=Tenuibacillus multivorans TaxID=237069 RepID=A0A1G9ZA98_9BACI|nr:hypothetical protein [Tenuibacillus multivorans]GEL77330.1 hypothetical protein TMU01_15650 [Tenuibacillus multivorans]SDN18320.1 hypothetical protein SAMN05216498_1611 [Tenuibacillus multivorans]
MRTVVQSFALGILTTTTIIGIVFFIGNSEPVQSESANEESSSLTVETAQAFLEEEDYAVVTSTSYEEIQVENKQLQNKVEQLQSQLEEQEEQEVDDEPENTEQDEVEDLDQNTETTHTFTLIIESGMTSIDIANELAEADIISNADEFNQFLEQNRYSRDIQLGEYDLTSQLNYEEIAHIITN